MFIALLWGISSSGRREISLLHGGKIWEEVITGSFLASGWFVIETREKSGRVKFEELSSLFRMKLPRRKRFPLIIDRNSERSFTKEMVKIIWTKSQGWVVINRIKNETLHLYILPRLPVTNYSAINFIRPRWWSWISITREWKKIFTRRGHGSTLPCD